MQFDRLALHGSPYFEGEAVCIYINTHWTRETETTPYDTTTEAKLHTSVLPIWLWKIPLSFNMRLIVFLLGRRCALFIEIKQRHYTFRGRVRVYQLQPTKTASRWRCDNPTYMSRGVIMCPTSNMRTTQHQNARSGRRFKPKQRRG